MRRTHRKLLMGIAVAATAAIGLSGCSGTSSADSGDKVTLQYAIWDKNQQPAMDKIIDAFEDDHPSITIETQLTPFKDYWTKLQTAMKGGSGPDVFWMNGPNFKLYAANDQLEPLDVDASSYSQALVDLYTLDKTTYGAPKDFDTIGVWYNTELFDAAGVEYPSEGWTWDDYRNIAEELTDKDAGVWGSAAALNDQQNYYNTIAQAGGEVISSDGTSTGYGSPEALTGIGFWVDQIKNGVSPTQQQMIDTSPEDMFTSGKVAMYWSGSWSAVAYHDNKAIADHVNVAPLPKGPTGNQSVIHGLANVVNSASAHKDAAKEFALFASGEEAAEIQAEAGAVIPAYNDTQKTWVESMPDYNLQVFIDAMDTAVPYPASQNTAAWTSIQDQTLSQVWALALDPKKGLESLATKMQTALDAEQK